MDFQEAVSKARKLLALASHARSNVNESALAAAKAAEIMREYQISEAALCTPEDDAASDPVRVHEFERAARKNKLHWRMEIAKACARNFDCYTYWFVCSRGSDIHIIGRERDVAATRYLYDMITAQVEELTAREKDERKFRVVLEHMAREAKAGKKFIAEPETAADVRAYFHAFKLGCAQTIDNRLYLQWKSQQDELESSGGDALMVVNSRLARIDKIKSDLGLSKGRGPSASNGDGYAAGKRAGQTVNIGGKARGAIGAPRGQIER